MTPGVEIKPLAVRRFLWMICFFLFAEGTLIFMGIWQIDRLSWKNELITRLEQRQDRPVVALSEIRDSENIGDYEYSRVSVGGFFINEHSFLLAPRIYKKQSGSHLVTPLLLPDEEIVIVNRGWVPQKYSLKMATELSRVTMVATVRNSSLQGTFTPDNVPSNGEWYWIDLKEVSQQIGSSVLPIILERSDSRSDRVLPIGGQTLIELPNNHLQYALTWFGLAFVFFVSFAIFCIKNRR